MASSGGAMFSKYVTHKSRLQIAGFHKPCGVVNLYKEAKPILETICDKLATPYHLTLLVCECQTEDVLNSVQNCGGKCSTCFGDAFFMTETLSLVLILIYRPHKSLSHTANQQKVLNHTVVSSTMCYELHPKNHIQ